MWSKKFSNLNACELYFSNIPTGLQPSGMWVDPLSRGCGFKSRNDENENNYVF